MYLSVKDYIYHTKTGVLLPKDLFEEKNKSFFENFKRKYLENNNNSQDSKIKNLSKSALIGELSNLNNLALEVTEFCNLSCRYCIYSENYVDQRQKTSKNMTIGVAKRSIDFFFNWIKHNFQNRTLPLELSLGYYGGEPLVNIEVIKASLDYSKSIIDNDIFFKNNNAHISYAFTTNGTLADKYIDYIVKNKFNILVSIDGPERVSDKNRGQNTFKKVMDFLDNLYRNYTGYYKKKVGISIVYASDTDLKEVIDFFCQDIFEYASNISFGDVAQLGLKNSALRKNKKKYFHVIKEIENKIHEEKNLNKIEKSIFRSYFEFEANLLGNFGLRSKEGGCIQGSKKLFVDVDGNFFGCEKVGRSFKIGDLETGFDLDYIKKLDDIWRKSVDNCERCVCQAFCGACIAVGGLEGKINQEKYFCKEYRKEFIKKLEEYIEVYEN